MCSWWGAGSEGGNQQPVGECFFPQFLSMFWPCSAGFGSLPVAYLFLCISQLKHLTIPLKSCPQHPSYTHPLIPAADGNERGKGQSRGSEEVEIWGTDETKGLITCALCSGAAAWVLWCTWLYNGSKFIKGECALPASAGEELLPSLNLIRWLMAASATLTHFYLLIKNT